MSTCIVNCVGCSYTQWCFLLQQRWYQRYQLQFFRSCLLQYAHLHELIFYQMLRNKKIVYEKLKNNMVGHVQLSRVTPEMAESAIHICSYTLSLSSMIIK